MPPQIPEQIPSITHKKALNLSVTKNSEKMKLSSKSSPVTKERWDQLSLNFFWHGWELLRTAWTGRIFPAAWISSILYLYSGENDAKLCILPCCLSQESSQHRAPPAPLCAPQAGQFGIICTKPEIPPEFSPHSGLGERAGIYLPWIARINHSLLIVKHFSLEE